MSHLSFQESEDMSPGLKQRGVGMSGKGSFHQIRSRR